MDIYLFILTLATGTEVAQSRQPFMDCLTSDITNGETNLYNATEISTALGEVIVNSNGSDTNNMLRASQYFVINETTLVAKWYTNRYTCCLSRLQHFLLRVVQYLEGSQKYTQFILINISGNPFVNQKTTFSMNCSRLLPGAYRAEFTLWFLGRLKQSTDGKVSADINRDSFIKTEVNLNKDYIERKRLADKCICSANITIRESTSDSEAIIKARIQGYDVPEQTPVEIQLVKVSKDGHFLEKSRNVFGKDIQNPFDMKYEVKKGHTYYIRVIRKCFKDFPVSCWKDEADVTRSAYLSIGSLSTGNRKKKRKRSPC